jgi:TRAP-type C4-dicarboxylate transport system permease small subunit
MKAMKLSRVNERSIAVAEIICALFLLLIAGLTIAQVILRYIFNYPLIWSEELSILVFIYLGFIGIGVAYAQGRHLYVDALLVTLPKSIRKVIEGIALGFSCVFLLVVIVQMIKVMLVTSKVGITTPALLLPMIVIYVSLPIGCLLFLIQVVRRFWNLRRMG